MFDAFIIDRIREDEARRQRESRRPYLEVPPTDQDAAPDRDAEPRAPERGVVIIERGDEG